MLNSKTSECLYYMYIMIQRKIPIGILLLVGASLQVPQIGTDRWYYHPRILTDSTESIAGSESNHDTIDTFRVVPTIETLNSIAREIFQRTILKFQENKTQNVFNSTFMKVQARKLFIKYDTKHLGFFNFENIDLLGDAFLSKNTDDEIIFTQVFRLKEIQICYIQICHTEFIMFENVLKLNIIIKTTFDNSNCYVHSLGLADDSGKFRLIVKASEKNLNLFESLFQSLTEHYNSSIMPIIKLLLLPYFEQSVEENDLCKIFNPTF